MPDKQKKLVTLIEVDNLVKADLIQSILRGSGIFSHIPDKAFGMAFSGVFGLKIQVYQEDLEKARELLRAAEEENNNYS